MESEWAEGRPAERGWDAAGVGEWHVWETDCCYNCYAFLCKYSPLFRLSSITTARWFLTSHWDLHRNITGYLNGHHLHSYADYHTHILHSHALCQFRVPRVSESPQVLRGSSSDEVGTDSRKVKYSIKNSLLNDFRQRKCFTRLFATN